jgi:hypothetical protein
MLSGLRCGSDRGVIFETGFRRRDPIYDGGDAYYEPEVISEELALR